MSEIQNNEGLSPAGGQFHGEQAKENSKDVAFKGEKTDLRYDPGAFIKRSWVNSPVKAQMNGHAVTFGSKEILQARKDLKAIDENPGAVEKATALYPAFQGYAKKQNSQNPEALALALEHYAATNEFIKDAELEQKSG